LIKITFREERCKGCQLCTTVCPKGIVVMAGRTNEMGYHPATVTQQEKCTGCGLCALMCPDMVIEVEREAKAV